MSRYAKSNAKTTPSTPFHVISPEEFDPTKLILDDYVKTVYDINKKQVTTEKSPLVYFVDGEKRKLYVKAPQQTVYGPQWQHGDLKKDDESKDAPKGDATKGKPLPVESRTGVQQSYPLTSVNTVSAPTEEEAAFIDFLNVYAERVRRLVTQYCKSSGCKLRANTKAAIVMASNAITEAEESGDEEALEAAKAAWDETMRAIVWHPKEATDKNGNPKQSSLYIPLITSKKGAAMSIQTHYFTEDGEDVDIASITFDFGAGSVRGLLTPMICPECVTWGGKKYTFGVKVTLIQALWAQLESASSVPSESLFGTTAQPIEKFRARAAVSFAEEVEEEEAEDEAPPKRVPSKAKTISKAAKRTPLPEVEEDEVLEEEEAPPPPKRAPVKAKASKRAPPEEYEEEEEDAPPPKRTPAKAKATKRAPPPEEYEEEEEDAPPPKRTPAKAKATKRAPPPEEYEEEE